MPYRQRHIAKVDCDRLVEAVRLNRQHWIDTGWPISAKTCASWITQHTPRDVVQVNTQE